MESFSPTVPPRLADNGVEIKDIEDVTCDRPVVTAEQLRLWAWMADYYLCNIGDVYKAAVPVRMRMESETVVELADDPEDGRSDLSDSERKIVEAVRALKECPLSRIVSTTGLKSITSRISSLIDKGVLVIKEELRQSYKPKYETRVRLSDKYADERALNELFGQLGGKRQQLNVLMKYVELSKAYAGIPQREVSKKEMEQAAGFSESALKTLRDKGIMEVYKAETGRLATGHAATVPLHELTEAQTEAYCAIKDAFARKNVCLLHGVTSSGKTEIYIRLIQDALNKGMQVLYMLPEIALTKQITERLERVFGDKLGIYHSKFPDNERVEIWRKQSGDAPYDIIVGVRSSVFLPFRRLGLVIVDEEHENTYKQYDPAPRYHARDTAVMFASMLGAKTLLGSATPSIESFCNARAGKYAYVRLATRFKDVELPQIPEDWLDYFWRHYGPSPQWVLYGGGDHGWSALVRPHPGMAETERLRGELAAIKEETQRLRDEVGWLRQALADAREKNARLEAILEERTQPDKNERNRAPSPPAANSMQPGRK